MSLVALALMGIGLGLRHALEADHVAAVCALVSRDQGSAERAPLRPARAALMESVTAAARSGALWGLGHGAAIILAGGALIALGARVPASIAALLDAAVAIMLVVLGVTAVRSALTGGEPGAIAHHGHHHGERPASARRPLFIGLLHGASGTAALTLLVAAQIPARVEAFAFVVLFSVASVASMTIAAALLAWPLHSAVRRAPMFARRLRGASGLASIAAGLAVAWTVIVPSALS